MKAYLQIVAIPLSLFLGVALSQSTPPKPVEDPPLVVNGFSSVNTANLITQGPCGTYMAQLKGDGRCHFRLQFDPSFAEVKCAMVAPENGQQVMECVWDAKPEEKDKK